MSASTDSARGQRKGEQEAAESTASTGGRRFVSFLGQHLRDGAARHGATPGGVPPDPAGSEQTCHLSCIEQALWSIGEILRYAQSL
jgi:hypothetical protein